MTAIYLSYQTKPCADGHIVTWFATVSLGPRSDWYRVGTQNVLNT